MIIESEDQQETIFYQSVVLWVEYLPFNPLIARLRHPTTITTTTTTISTITYLESTLFLLAWLHTQAGRGVLDGPGGGTDGGHHEDGHHLALGQDRLGGLVGLPSQVAEQMSCGLAEVLPAALELVDHDVHKPGEGAEIGFDTGVTECQVGQSNHSVASHLTALSAGTVGGVGLVLHLEYK